MSTGDREFATFYLNNRLYGIEVTQVQEVTQRHYATVVRLAPKFVKGLVNLRGQIATSIGMKELFEMESLGENPEGMAIVCKIDSNLISFEVDRAGDVLRVPSSAYESVPETISGRIRGFLDGVYKINEDILSVISIENIANELNPKTGGSHG